MKTIEAVSIWDNGTVQQATILNAYAVNVTLNTSATFWYGLFAETTEGNVGSQLAQGNLTMTGEAYTDWTVDNYAWDWIAEQLNLVIIGPHGEHCGCKWFDEQGNKINYFGLGCQNPNSKLDINK
jgi:hypothetical protein